MATQLKRGPERLWWTNQCGVFPDQTDLGGGDAFCWEMGQENIMLRGCNNRDTVSPESFMATCQTNCRIPF
jgi:hypothetical protein